MALSSSPGRNWRCFLTGLGLRSLSTAKLSRWRPDKCSNIAGCSIFVRACSGASGASRIRVVGSRGSACFAWPRLRIATCSCNRSR